MQALEIPEFLLVRELVARKGLHEFVKQFWHLVEPDPFQDNWHIGAMCEFCQAIFEEQILRGVMNVVPGAGKSLITDVFFPAYCWSRKPAFKMLAGSYDQGLILRDAKKVVEIMDSPLFQDCYPDARLKGPDHALGLLETTALGLQLAISVQGKGVGWHGNIVRIDDPVKPEEARAKSDTGNKRSISWYRSTLNTRRSDPAHFRVLLTMQRLAKTDLSQYLLDLGGFEHLCLPMRYEPKAIWIKGDWSARLDPRKEKGELLFPKRFPAEVVKDLERGLSTTGNINAQMQQNPTPDTGGVVELKWFKYYDPEELPQGLTYVQFWDLNFKGEQESHSMVQGSLFAFGSSRIYLIAEVRGLWNYPTAKRMYIETQSRPVWRECCSIFVEAKANGSALCADIRAHNQENGTCVPEPIEQEVDKGDKIFRLRKGSTTIEGGHLYIPQKNLADPQETEWIYDNADGWLQEIVGFPNVAKNDRADTLSAMLNWYSGPMASALRWEET